MPKTFGSAQYLRTFFSIQQKCVENIMSMGEGGSFKSPLPRVCAPMNKSLIFLDTFDQRTSPVDY